MGRGEDRSAIAVLEPRSAAPYRAQQKIKVFGDLASNETPEESFELALIDRHTKNGLPIQIKITRHSEAYDRDSLWVIDRLDVSSSGEPAGYLKLSYIPSDVISSRIPSGFTWAINRLGIVSISSRESICRNGEKSSEWNDAEELREVIKSLSPWDAEGLRRSLPGMNLAELRREFDLQKERLNDSHRDARAEFVRTWRDRPLVDFSRVYDAEERRAIIHPDGEIERIAPSHRSWKRQGVARAMYKTAAVWMRERGMRVHASNTQSDEALAFWASLERDGFVSSEPGKSARRYLDADKLLAAHPELSLR